MASCQVPVHGSDKEVPKAKYKCPQCLIHYCSLTCFKIHKESCQPKDQSENGKSTTEKEVSQKDQNVSSSDSLPSTKVQKEYAILSPGQLAILRKTPDAVKAINSPTLETLFRNILSGIPCETDLTDLTEQTSLPLEKALSLLQEVRTMESGPVTQELETLIDQIHMISGEYRP